MLRIKYEFNKVKVLRIKDKEKKTSPKLLDAIQNILHFTILVILIFLIPKNSIMLGFTKRTEIEEVDQGYEERASKPSGFNLKIGFLVIYLSSLMFLLSSNYFEAQLPTKVASFDIEYYQNPSSVLEKIFEITEEGTVKVIEPSLYIDEHQARLDMMIYEYYNDSSSVNETELNAFSTGLIFLQELESPFKNYFGLNGDLYYDIVDFFENTIYTLYFDEFATEFEDSMDLNNLIHWIQVNNNLRFVLFFLIIIYIVEQAISFLTPKNKFLHTKKLVLLSINICTTLAILGSFVVYCWIVHRYPSPINNFNLVTTIFIFIGYISANIYNFK